jgi:isopentenyl phosphate kinase
MKNEINSKKIVLKLGGSITTYKNVTSFPLELEKIKNQASDYIRSDVIKRLVEEIKTVTKENKIELIVTLGVGPFGHFLVKHWKELEDKMIVYKSVLLFTKVIANYFDDGGLKVDICDPTNLCRYKKGELIMDDLWSSVQKSLRAGHIPIIFGTMIPTDSNSKYDGYAVLSADRSSVELAIKWNADKIIMVMDEDGLYDNDPKFDKDAKFVKFVKFDEKLEIKESGVGIDVTGRISGKIENLQTAAKNGIRGQLINGLKEGYLKRALEGDESIGTLIIL